jgi:hypothetical protein
MGGIVNNNSGGERTLEYGKTERYIEEVEVVLSDGSLATFKALGPDELEEKKKLNTLEGDIYRKMSALILDNRRLIEAPAEGLEELRRLRALECLRYRRRHVQPREAHLRRAGHARAHDQGEARLVKPAGAPRHARHLPRDKDLERAAGDSARVLPFNPEASRATTTRPSSSR